MSSKRTSLHTVWLPELCADAKLHNLALSDNSHNIILEKKCVKGRNFQKFL